MLLPSRQGGVCVCQGSLKLYFSGEDAPAVGRRRVGGSPNRDVFVFKGKLSTVSEVQNIFVRLR